MNKVIATTTATNKKLRELLMAIRNKTLIPNPEFQRRLVWTNKDKVNFLRTVLDGYPFPEIYIAAGEVNPDTGEGTEMLVDGQQRITTLNQYFTGKEDTIRLPKDIPVYRDLEDKAKLDFLEYVVVVRDLGPLSIDEIKNVFTRINSTKYSLNAMEINNARYEGEFKAFGELLATHDFFEQHNVFTASKVRRMEDVRYTLTIVATVMSTYFNRDSELESFLQNYNDEFPEKGSIHNHLEEVIQFIEDCNFESDERVWKEADLFTLIVELYKKLIVQKAPLQPRIIEKRLKRFYYEVDHHTSLSDSELENDRRDLEIYSAAIFQGTNDRTKRIDRGKVISQCLWSYEEMD